MFLVILLFSFFSPINASDDEMVISVEEFLSSFRKFKDASCFEKDCVYAPLRPAPTEHLITVYTRRFAIDATPLIQTPDIFSFFSKAVVGNTEDLLRIFDMRVRTIKVHDPDGILMRGGIFTPAKRANASTLSGIEMYRAGSGTRTVGIYSYGDTKVCIKQWPEAPCNEIAVYQRYKSWFQAKHDEMPIPVSEVVLMDGQVFLISEFIEGESFEDVLRKVESDPTQACKYTFNLERFQKLAIFCLVSTVPEDCRLQNCIIRLIPGSEEYEFILIDNDRSLGRPITIGYQHPERGIIYTRCHCFLLCFHAMLRHPITESVHRAMSNSSAEFGDMIAREVNYQHIIATRVQAEDRKTIPLDIPIPGSLKSKRILFGMPYSVTSAADMLSSLCRVRVDASKTTILGTPFDASVFNAMLSRLRKFDEASADRSKSLASILAAVSPELATIYGFNDPVPVAITPPARSLTTVLLSKLASIFRLNKSPALSAATKSPVDSLITVSRRIRETDAGRCATTTPASADVPLESYLGSVSHTPDTAMDTMTTIWDTMTKDKEAVEALDDGKKKKVSDLVEYFHELKSNFAFFTRHGREIRATAEHVKGMMVFLELYRRIAMLLWIFSVKV